LWPIDTDGHLSPRVPWAASHSLRVRYWVAASVTGRGLAACRNYPTCLMNHPR